MIELKTLERQLAYSAALADLETRCAAAEVGCRREKAQAERVVAQL